MVISGGIWRGCKAVCLCVFVVGMFAHAAEPPATMPAMVDLSFPENMDLKVLIDYVGQRRNINFIYDSQVVNDKKVTIKAPQRLSVESLTAVLESALAMKGLMMSPTDASGMVRIEVAKPLTASSIGPSASATSQPGAEPGLALTRVFELRNASPAQAEVAIRPFLSTTTANVAALAGHKVLIVTDYAKNMPRIEDVLAVVDRPRPKVQVRFVAIEHLEAAMMEQKVTQVLTKKTQAAGGAPGGTAGGVSSGVAVLADARTNQLVVVGDGDDEVNDAIALIKSLDVSLGTETRTYVFHVAQAERVNRLVKDLIGELAAKRLYKSAIDQDANLLIATTTPEIHEQIEALRQTMDKPADGEESPIRFYKLENAKALAVLETLRGIEGDAGIEDVSVDGVSAGAKPMQAKDAAQGLVIKGPTESQVNPGEKPDGGSAKLGGLRKTVELQNARIMADEATNTIIVVAKPSVHAVYEKLIKRLDIRRPQVLIEATVVLVDTTDDFSLGVEISNKGDSNTITFSSFGLSEVDVNTGALTLSPGTGFNGTLLSADIADVVIRALESDERSKVVSRPSMLIDDNAKGELASENEEPYSSVNASSTVATTSFAGYSKAGTSIWVRPQISQGDHLKLEYGITLSSFGEESSESLPPPRQTNELVSEATTIPDGHTIVVGGLTREDRTQNVDRVPMLGRVPYLEYLFSNRSTSVRKETLFVFLHAVILRDDKFEALKILSRDAARRAELAGDYPTSDPVEIR